MNWGKANQPAGTPRIDWQRNHRSAGRLAFPRRLTVNDSFNSEFSLKGGLTIINSEAPSKKSSILPRISIIIDDSGLLCDKAAIPVCPSRAIRHDAHDNEEQNLPRICAHTWRSNMFDDFPRRDVDEIHTD
jgi:hypothetical protein